MLVAVLFIQEIWKKILFMGKRTILHNDFHIVANLAFGSVSFRLCQYTLVTLLRLLQKTWKFWMTRLGKALSDPLIKFSPFTPCAVATATHQQQPNLVAGKILIGQSMVSVVAGRLHRFTLLCFPSISSQASLPFLS